jgi:hypothetical protein
MIIGTFMNRGFCLICPARVKPSVSGICESSSGLCACAGVSKLSCARATTVLGLEHFRATADGGVLPCQDHLRECSLNATSTAKPNVLQMLARRSTISSVIHHLGDAVICCPERARNARQVVPLAFGKKYPGPRSFFHNPLEVSAVIRLELEI